MIVALRRTAVSLATVAAIASFGGCESIYGIGDLPHGPPCTPIAMASAPATGAAACAGPGACMPGDVSSYTPPWIPPFDRKGQCTSQQLADYFGKCIDPATAVDTACAPWLQDAQNGGCYGCLLVDPNAPTFGAAVRITGTTNFQVNRPGCIALAEPCNLPCAKAALAQVLCAYTACDPTGNCANSGDVPLKACLTRATGDPTDRECACQGFSAAAACVDTLTGLAHTKCNGNGPVDLYRNVGTFMCGPP